MKITEKAQFPGSCHICGGRIYFGDIIVRSTVGSMEVAAHAECDPDFAVGGSASPEVSA